MGDTTVTQSWGNMEESMTNTMFGPGAQVHEH